MQVTFGAGFWIKPDRGFLVKNEAVLKPLQILRIIFQKLHVFASGAWKPSLFEDAFFRRFGDVIKLEIKVLMVVDVNVRIVVVFQGDDLVAFHHVEKIETLDVCFKAVHLRFGLGPVLGNVSEENECHCSDQNRAANASDPGQSAIPALDVKSGIDTKHIERGLESLLSCIGRGLDLLGSS